MDSFLELLAKAGPKVTIENIHMRLAIPPGERLALTLRFLATGILRFLHFIKAWMDFIYQN